jgi:gliding motility-associated-like protein
MDQSPAFSLPLGVGGSYPVQLAVTSSNGCSDFINGVINVNELFNLFVPSAFTPNGDGINDVFKLQGTGIDVNNFQFDIFNRWGELVFSSKDPSQAWAGGVNGNDYYVPDGIYNYYISTNSLKSGERFEYKGTISIVR